MSWAFSRYRMDGGSAHRIVIGRIALRIAAGRAISDGISEAAVTARDARLACAGNFFQDCA